MDLKNVQPTAYSLHPAVNLGDVAQPQPRFSRRLRLRAVPGVGHHTTSSSEVDSTRDWQENCGGAPTGQDVNPSDGAGYDPPSVAGQLRGRSDGSGCGR